MGDFNGILTCPLFTGNVGIGTTTPAAPLDVNGAIDISGNNAVSFPPDTTTGGSIGIGPLALSNQAGGSSQRNTAVGWDSMAGSSSPTITGGYNVALGARSLTSVTSGSDNIAIGYEASYSLTSGSYSTAVGVAALKYASGSTGGYNTAIGYEAMNGVSGSGLTAAAGFNTAVGVSAAESLQGAAANNTIVGGQAGQYLTTASSDTVLGAAAGKSMTAASSDTLVGAQAGFALTSGSNNTIVGNNVGSSTLTGGTGNILIGTDSYTDAPSGESGQANYLDIGNAIYGYNLINNSSSTSPNISIDTNSYRSTYAFYVNGQAGGTTTWSSTSDARLKTDVTPITGALGVVERLQGVHFTWRKPGDRTVGKTISLPIGKPDIGFIAQDVAKVVPEAVDAPKDPTTEVYSLKDDKLIPLLVEAIKEQQAEIADLKSRIAVLEHH